MTNASQNFLVSHSNSYRPGILESFRSLFYLLRPSESKFRDISEVPNYTDAALPCFITLMLLELFICVWKRRRFFRINDGLTSLGAGVISRILRLFTTRSMEITLYIYVYDHWRLADLEWNSNLTWFIAFVGMDFFYYWSHRASHEINLFWASHQAHHSSEDYNFTTALRQASLQEYINMFFSVPNALIIPPQVHLVHSQLCVLYQFWIHTEVIDNIGPLEYILNTPSHHRVHHGRNPYCIDKNYGGTLIIWDRMFGTFAAEKKEEKIAYGLVHNINNFNPIYVQWAAFRDIFLRTWKIDGLWNKVCVLGKGPGWSPGKPRLGNPSELPQIKGSVEPYNPKVAKWLLAYGVLHFFAVVPIYDQILALRHNLPYQIILFGVVFFLVSLTCVSFLLDKMSYGNNVELVRCVISAVIMCCFKLKIEELFQLPHYMGDFLQALFIGSAIVWITKFVLTFHTKKQV